MYFWQGLAVRFQKTLLLTLAKQGRVNSEIFGVNSEIFQKNHTADLSYSGRVTSEKNCCKTFDGPVNSVIYFRKETKIFIFFIKGNIRFFFQNSTFFLSKIALLEPKKH